MGFYHMPTVCSTYKQANTWHSSPELVSRVENRWHLCYHCTYNIFPRSNYSVKFEPVPQPLPLLNPQQNLICTQQHRTDPDKALCGTAERSHTLSNMQGEQHYCHDNEVLLPIISSLPLAIQILNREYS